MDSIDKASRVLLPHLEEQARQAHRVRRRRTRQAKFFLVTATAIFSSYATYTIYDYLTRGKFQAFSLLVLLVLALGIRDRWRAA